MDPDASTLAMSPVGLRPSQIFRLMRPHQWIKNGFVLIGPFFAHRWDHATLLQVALAFASFCAMASAVYVFNDVMDAKADRMHPSKKYRPIASGAVSPRAGSILGVVLFILSCPLAWQASPGALILVLVYAALNIAYSMRLKRVVIIDVFVIAAGFMLRLLVGTAGIGIPPSSWLLLCGLMLTLFLGFTKRRSELANRSDSSGVNLTRSVLESYSPALLDQFQSIAAACTILSYALYTVSSDAVVMHGSDHLIYTVPLVVYGIFRYTYLLHARQGGQDTARDLVKDRHLLLTTVCWIALTFWIMA